MKLTLHHIRLISILLIMSLLSFGSFSQTDRSISFLLPEPGDFEVGFTVKMIKDYQRSFASESYRSIPIHIWYPAASNNRFKMRLSDYSRISDSVNLFENGSLGFSGWASRMKADTSKLQKILQEPTISSFNAEVAEGSFPVIFYASSFRSRPIENFALFEYLASNGFVVIAVPSIGKTTAGMSMDIEGVEMQYQDLIVAYKMAKELEYIDIENSASMGFSLGAVPAALMALKLPDFNSVISIDGAMSYSYFLIGDAIERLEPKLPCRFLEILQRTKESQPVSETFFDLQSKATASRIQYETMDHYDFSSLTLLLKSIRPDGYTPSQQAIDLNGINSAPYSQRFETYRSMCKMLLIYFQNGI